ncbi:hypothetical protein QRX60_31875 [Amycolatopsis mongoliensis]|uniref:Uncharacterized protein n=1 Tax=Amycolatopsis mongoliensis TaxID=715475 RepID=A0A9Y2NEG0_9PSEU|nr:hypothetical protein [Amycolatopsis sp. 4-36]WIX98648.1 hypothetical protein QRX60_31875 [Amycolatopsis sp. 4-36]
MNLNFTELTPEQWITRITRQHDAQIPELETLDSYYKGSQSLAYMHPELLCPARLLDRASPDHPEMTMS